MVHGSMNVVRVEASVARGDGEEEVSYDANDCGDKAAR